MSENGNGKKELVEIFVDGQPVKVLPGINAIEAAKVAGKEIPHYCYHPKLSVVGNCRMCLMEMGTPMRDRETGEPILEEDGSQKIGWIPKPVIGCSTNVSPGMHIKTESDLVKDCREGVMEFLLVNHPLDCPICDQAGECSLQEYAMDYGRGYSRYEERKNVKPKRTRLGPRVTLDDERCVLCSRCIRFGQEIADQDVLGFVDRGSFSTLTCHPNKELDHNYSLNTVDICPVGALTSTDFRFKMRVWFLKESPSICTESSIGANTTVWSREGTIHRITPRRNDTVNDTWMTDSGRELFNQVTADTRLTSFQIGGNSADATASIEEATGLLSKGKTAVVASCHQSVEEQFITRKIADHLNSSVYIARHLGKGDGLLLSEDRTPNTRGALLNGLTDNLPTEDLSSLAEKIDSEKVDTLLVCREDLTRVGLSEAQLEKVKLVLLDTQTSATASHADVQLPALTVFEKNGTFVNLNFRLQKFSQAVPGPAGLLPDTLILSKILSTLTGESFPDSPATIWKSLSQSNSNFKDIDFSSIPTDGIQLEKSAFDHIDFPEKQSLKYSPAAITG